MNITIISNFQNTQFLPSIILITFALPGMMMMTFFYWTQVYLGSDLWVAGVCKGSPTELSVTSIWALPIRGGGSKPLPKWFGALF